MANHTSKKVLTDEEMREFCEALADGCRLKTAIERVGISYGLAHKLRREQPDFAAMWDEAQRIGISALEDEAHRRAFEGNDEPVFYQGDVVGAVTKYSDTLAMFLLRAHNPKRYRDNASLELHGPNGGPVEFTDTQLALRLAAIMSSAKTEAEEHVPKGEDGEPLL